MKRIKCDDVPETIGELIVAARRRRRPKMSQQQAADLVGVSRQTFSGYENGAVVPKEVLRTLAEIWNDPELSNVIMMSSERPQDGRIPDYGRVPCGSFDLSGADVSLTNVPSHLAVPGTVSVTVGGDSMEPNLRPGDRLAVRLTSSPPPGSIVLVRSAENELSIKRYTFVDGKPALLSDNANYPALDVRGVTFVGQVMELYSRMIL
jgi:SOS-response transcriptional repressor LexA